MMRYGILDEGPMRNFCLALCCSGCIMAQMLQEIEYQKAKVTNVYATDSPTIKISSTQAWFHSQLKNKYFVYLKFYLFHLLFWSAFCKTIISRRARLWSKDSPQKLSRTFNLKNPLLVLGNILVTTIPPNRFAIFDLKKWNPSIFTVRVFGLQL